MRDIVRVRKVVIRSVQYLPDHGKVDIVLHFLRVAQMRQGWNEGNDVESGQPPDDLRIDDSDEYPVGHHDQVEATDQLDHPQDAAYLAYLDALRELIVFALKGRFPTDSIDYQYLAFPIRFDVELISCDVKVHIIVKFPRSHG